jgi:F-type H+-transporting ATPase subunit epsilon
MTVRVELVSPERIAYSGEAKMVIARTLEGDAAFLEGHVPFIAVLQTWPVKVVHEDDTTETIAVHSGFVEVSSDEAGTRVTILSDVAELADTIDTARAQRACDRAMHALASDPHDAEALAALQRAEVRLRAAGEVPSINGH